MYYVFFNCRGGNAATINEEENYLSSGYWYRTISPYASWDNDCTESIHVGKAGNIANSGINESSSGVQTSQKSYFDM